MKKILNNTDTGFSFPFISGVLFAYFTVFPLAVFVLIQLASEFEPMLTVSKYLSFTLAFLIPFGLVFELPLVVYFLTSIGVITRNGCSAIENMPLSSQLSLPRY